MSWQTVIRFCMSLRETFSSSITFSQINKYGKYRVVQIATVFRPIYRVACHRVVWTGRSRQLSTHVLRSQKIRKQISYEGQIFWKCSKFNVHFKNAQQHSETFSNSITFTKINKYRKGAVNGIETVFRPVYHVAGRRILWNGTF